MDGMYGMVTALVVQEATASVASAATATTFACQVPPVGRT
jgi:hypothetical protein